MSATDNTLGREVPSRPKWRGDSKELYYVAPNRKLMAVQILPGNELAVRLPKPLFAIGDLESDYDDYPPAGRAAIPRQATD